MNKSVLGLAILSSFSLYAEVVNYDYKVKTQVKCYTVKNATQSVRLHVQRETFIGVDGPISNTAYASVSILGEFDGENVDVGESYRFKKLSSQGIFADKVEYKLSEGDAKVSKSLLSNLTGDESIPGVSLKIEMPIELSWWTKAPGIAHAVYEINPSTNSGPGFVSLDVGEEHFETLAVTCEEIRDSADKGDDYTVDFE